MPHYLLIDGFMPSWKVLKQSEMQTASSRFLNRVAYSISYADNRYANMHNFQL